MQTKKEKFKILKKWNGMFGENSNVEVKLTGNYEWYNLDVNHNLNILAIDSVELRLKSIYPTDDEGNELIPFNQLPEEKQEEFKRLHDMGKKLEYWDEGEKKWKDINHTNIHFFFDCYRLKPEPVYKIGNLKAGQKVKVLRIAKDYENGWDFVWASVMDKYAGKILEIKEDEKTGRGVKLFTPDKNDFCYFPNFVLELVEDEYRAFETLEEFAPFAGWWFKKKETDVNRIVTTIKAAIDENTQNLLLGPIWRSFKELHEYYQMSNNLKDWQPCGVKI